MRIALHPVAGVEKAVMATALAESVVYVGQPAVIPQFHVVDVIVLLRG